MTNEEMLARIEGLIEKWDSTSDRMLLVTQRDIYHRCADDLRLLRDELKKERP